jgi:uroporphyrinogen decarboxylase
MPDREHMTRIERVKAALAGSEVDRPPYGFWTHLPGIDLDPERLASESAAFARRYDMDFLKSMPNGLYCVEDWGCVCDYGDIERGGVARVVKAAVNSQSDWYGLGKLDVSRGAYGRELGHLTRLVESVGPDIPVLATAFSPLTIAAKLSNGLSREHLQQDPRAVRHGLEIITEVTSAFVRAALDSGCAGVFFAMQEATRSAFSEADYRLFGEPHDRLVLLEAATAGGWFNLVHMHGEDILFDVVKDYDVAALNWHIGETPPTIAEYRDGGGTKPVVGGLQRGHITRRDRPGIENDIASATAETRGRGLLIAPACVIRHPVDDATLLWTAERIKGLAKM